jgi:hypothetical protein
VLRDEFDMGLSERHDRWLVRLRLAASRGVLRTNPDTDGAHIKI